VFEVLVVDIGLPAQLLDGDQGPVQDALVHLRAHDDDDAVRRVGGA